MTMDTAQRPLKATKIARGTFWAGIDNWSQQAIQIIVFIKIGNVIGPAALGLWAVAFLYANLIYALAVDSFTEVIVQRKDLNEDHKTSAFWAIAGAGIVIALVSLVAAYGVGAMFRMPEVVPVIQALAPIFGLYGLCSFFQAMIRRQMKYHIMAFRSLVAVGTAAVIGLYLAAQGAGIWSLVIFQLVWRILDFTILFIASRWLPKFRFSWTHFKELTHYGGFSVGVSVVAYLNMNADRAVVGLFLGQENMGLFSMARRLVDSITFALTGVFNTVAMTVFSRLQTEKKVLGQTIVSTTQVSTLVGFPTFAGLAVVADPLVRGFLEPAWLPMIPILQILCLGAALSSIVFVLGTAVRSYGRADITFKVQATVFVIRVLALLALLGFGLGALALVNALVFIALLPVQFAILNRLLGIKTRTLLLSMGPALWSSLGMGLVTVSVLQLLQPYLGPLPLLAVIVLTGIVSYGAILFLTSRNSLGLLVRFLKERNAT